MNIDFNYCDNIEIENEVIIPEGLTDEEKIKYLTQKINDTNNTLNRLAIILRDFQMIVERNMNVDYTLLQEIQSELYSHTHSFHSMLIAKQNQNKEENDESNIP